MKNVTLLILEKGKCYGERLAAFLGRQAYSPFNIQLYLEHPISDEKWKKADLVLNNFITDGAVWGKSQRGVMYVYWMKVDK